MTEFLQQCGSWGVLATLAAYAAGVWVNRKTGKALFNPLLMGSIFVIVFLSCFGVPYADYKSSAQPVSWLLMPATVSLAIPLYEKWELLEKNLAAIFAPCIFRCPYTDMQAILRSSDAEKRFFERLIAELDTASATTIAYQCNPNTVDYVSPTEGLLPSGRAAITPSSAPSQPRTETETEMTAEAATVASSQQHGTQKAPDSSGMP